jgi:hypothetical protein
MIVVLSRYSISMMVIGAMAIFTVKFWSMLWYLALWVDQNLILSMYPDVNVFYCSLLARCMKHRKPLS